MYNTLTLYMGLAYLYTVYTVYLTFLEHLVDFLGVQVLLFYLHLEAQFGEDAMEPFGVIVGPASPIHFHAGVELAHGNDHCPIDLSTPPTTSSLGIS